MRFQTLSGELQVWREEGLLWLDFPAIEPASASLPQGLAEALGVQPLAVRKARSWLLELDSQAAVAAVQPDFAALVEASDSPVIVTARGDDCDFVSRFFAPMIGIDEDPVTGSAHCMLVPYWANILQGQSLEARQISKRVGYLSCRHLGARVQMGGAYQLYLSGQCQVPV